MGTFITVVFLSLTFKVNVKYINYLSQNLKKVTESSGFFVVIFPESKGDMLFFYLTCRVPLLAMNSLGPDLLGFLHFVVLILASSLECSFTVTSPVSEYTYFLYVTKIT